MLALVIATSGLHLRVLVAAISDNTGNAVTQDKCETTKTKRLSFLVLNFCSMLALAIAMSGLHLSVLLVW